MPSFGDDLTDDQIWSIIRYYQSLWPEKIRKMYLQRFPDGLGP
jgi:mono/diheme cytochrome c family protein